MSTENGQHKPSQAQEARNTPRFIKVRVVLPDPSPPLRSSSSAAPTAASRRKSLRDSCGLVSLRNNPSYYHHKTPSTVYVRPTLHRYADEHPASGLVEKHSALIWTFCENYIKTRNYYTEVRETIEELYSESIHTILRRWANFDPSKGNFQEWARHIVWSTWKDMEVKAGAVSRPRLAPNHAETLEKIVENLADTSRRDNTPPPKKPDKITVPQWQALILVKWYEFSWAEAAAVICVTESNIGNLMKSAIAVIKKDPTLLNQA